MLTVTSHHYVRVHPQCVVFTASCRWRCYPRKAPRIVNNHRAFMTQQ